MKAKEWWIRPTSTGRTSAIPFKNMVGPSDGYTHVIEKMPDTVTITRHDLHMAYRDAVKVLDLEELNALELALFASTETNGGEK